MVGGVVGGVPGGVPRRAMITVNATVPTAAASEDRKLVRTGSMDLVVKNPGEAAEALISTANQLVTGGLITSRQSSQESVQHCRLIAGHG